MFIVSYQQHGDDFTIQFTTLHQRFSSVTPPDRHLLQFRKCPQKDLWAVTAYIWLVHDALKNFIPNKGWKKDRRRLSTEWITQTGRQHFEGSKNDFVYNVVMEDNVCSMRAHDVTMRGIWSRKMDCMASDWSNFPPLFDLFVCCCFLWWTITSFGYVKNLGCNPTKVFTALITIHDLWQYKPSLLN